MENNPLDKKKQAYQKAITEGRLVEETVNSKGWEEVVKPILDKMISDVIGSKHGDMWDAGVISLTDKGVDYQLGYRQGLIDINNKVYHLIEQIESCANKIKEIENLKKSPDVMPMEKGRYAPREEI